MLVNLLVRYSIVELKVLVANIVCYVYYPVYFIITCKP